MAWLLLLAVLAPLGVTLIVGRVARARRARRGWREWHAQRRSGALAWTLFRRRPRLPRLTDRRER